jgi:hypothetical protein
LPVVVVVEMHQDLVVVEVELEVIVHQVMVHPH